METTLWCDHRVAHQEVMSSNPKCISQDAVAKLKWKRANESPLVICSFTYPSAIPYVCAFSVPEEIQNHTLRSAQPCPSERICP